MAEQVLAGRYRLVRRLGSGAMGQVWLAHDELLHRDVALKQLLLDEGTADPASVERAMREARLSGRLNHPHAVALHDLVMEDGQPTLVMEYVDGQTLAERLSTRGHLSIDEACDVFAQVAGAITAAHAIGTSAAPSLTAQFVPDADNGPYRLEIRAEGLKDGTATLNARVCRNHAADAITCFFHDVNLTATNGRSLFTHTLERSDTYVTAELSQPGGPSQLVASAHTPD